jgi:carboxyl-terminal processing protease
MAAPLLLPAPATRTTARTVYPGKPVKVLLGTTSKGKKLYVTGKKTVSEWKEVRFDAEGRPKQLSGARKKSLGRVFVERRYTPLPDGRTTQITQTLVRLNRAIPRNETEAAKATFEKVLKIAQKHHLHRDKFTRKDLYHMAAAGIAKNLPDRFSFFLPPQVARAYSKTMRNDSVGIGAMLQENWDRRKGETMEVLRTFRGGPARKAGIHRGDVIVAIDGKKVDTLDQAMEGLRGKQGEVVRLSILRRGDLRHFEIKRDHYDRSPVETRLRRGVGYLRLAKFDYRSAEKVDKAIAALKKQHGGALKGLILDLRNNSGGEYKNALAIINRFVAAGTLVTREGPGGKLLEKAVADPARAVDAKLPLAVLINEVSASASELVSGALQARGRATVLGRRSRGKGTVLHVRPMPDGSQFGLIAELYRLPNGETPDRKGVTPDISHSEAKARYIQTHGRGGRGIDYVYEAAHAHLRGQER